jgi:hypothetical protein
MFSPRRSITTYYKIASLIIYYLGAFTVGEATASVRRTELAVVRHKCTNRRVTRKRDSDQTRPADTCREVPYKSVRPFFPFIFDHRNRPGFD